MKEKVQGLLTLGLLVGYVGLGLFQWSAVLAGIEAWWGWPQWLALIVGLPIAMMPVVGTIVGIMGAIDGFGWSPAWAIVLFVGPNRAFFMASVVTSRRRA